MNENEISRIVVQSCLNVHKSLGPGLLESAYESWLLFDLKKKGLNVESQKGMPLIYEEIKMEVAYRLDLFIESKVIIEIKSVSELNDIHLAQILTYLKLSDCKLGFLENFNVPLIKNGIRRVVNKL